MLLKMLYSCVLLLLLTGCTNLAIYKGEQNSFGQNDLMRAIYFQDLTKVIELVESGRDLNETDVNDANVLHYTAMYGTEEIAEYLLAQNTDHLQLQKGGLRRNIPLQDAFLTQNMEVFEILKEAYQGSMVDLVDDKGKSFLHYYASLHNEEMVDSLLREGADPNLQDVYGNTPGHLFLYNLELKPIKSNQRSVKQISISLFTHGMNPEIVNQDGESFRTIVESADMGASARSEVEKHTLLDVVASDLWTTIIQFSR